MSYRATVTMPDAEPATICDYVTLSDARMACSEHLREVWHAARGSERLLDPVYAYDRGAFSQWDCRPRLYVIMPDGVTAHYDIAELPR